MGTKISELSAVASLLGTDEIPLRRSAGNAKFTPATLVEYLNTQGFGGFGAWDLITANPAALDLSTNNKFVVSIDSAANTTITCSNAPYSGYEFFIMIFPQINVTSITLSTGFSKQFGVTLPINLTAFQETWVRCVWTGTDAYYQIIPESPSTATAAQIYTFDVTIPSADVLTSFTTPVEIIAAPGSGLFIDVVSMKAQLVGGTGGYATNTQGLVGVNFGANPWLGIDLSDDTSCYYFSGESGSYFDTIGNLDNDAIEFSTQTGNPTAGDTDLRIWGTYLIRQV